MNKYLTISYGLMNIRLTILLYISPMSIYLYGRSIGAPIAVIYLDVKSTLLNLYRIWLQKRLFHVIYNNSRSGYRT